MNNSPYQQRLDRNARAFRWFVLVLTVAFVACWVIYGLLQVGSRPQPSVEEQLNDTLSGIKPASAPFQNHWPAPTFKTKEDIL